MNKPIIFISSTIYDFADLRSSMKYWLDEMGFTTQLSEYNDFIKDTTQNSYDACILLWRTDNSIHMATDMSGKTVFRRAFADEPNLSKIYFDCEAGGFFCYADSLSLMEDLGSRFKSMIQRYVR